jgi:hypothetical protein
MSVGPFSAEGLDEAFGFAVSLRAVSASEDVFEAKLEACGGEVFRSVGWAVVGHDGGDFYLVPGEEEDAFAEGGDGAWDFFVFEDSGKAKSGVVVDGDVEGLSASSFVAIGAVAGGTDTRFMEAA